MKLLYKPIYKPELDEAFYKRIGRNSNPLRFGLTKLQIQHLKQLGQWEEFLRVWQTKRILYLAKHKLNCYLCGSNRRKGITVLGKRICSKCQEKIRRIVE
jgi:hypothetical protein